MVQINELVFPTDFSILDMNAECSPTLSLVISETPFFSTAEMKIDVKRGTITMKFGGEVVHFNIFNEM